MPNPMTQVVPSRKSLNYQPLKKISSALSQSAVACQPLVQFIAMEHRVVAGAFTNIMSESCTGKASGFKTSRAHFSHTS